MLEAIASSLLKAGMYERAGDFLERLGMYEQAIEARPPPCVQPVPPACLVAAWPFATAEERPPPPDAGFSPISSGTWTRAEE